MPIPDFGALLIQFEQLDNQKEQLLLQRQEQSARNIAQAVSTLVATPREGRAGYLQTLSNELGLDTRFLSALAEAAPTPTAILLNQGLEKGLANGAVSETDLTAYALGADPIAFRMREQIGSYFETGKVPAYIAAMPPEAQGPALNQMLTQFGGLPNVYELTNQEDLTKVKGGLKPEANTMAQIGAQAEQGNKNRAVQYSQMAQQQRQFDSAQNENRLQFLGENATRVYLGEIAAGARMATSKYGTSKATTGAAAAAGGEFSEMNDADFYKNFFEYQQFAGGLETSVAKGKVGSLLTSQAELEAQRALARRRLQQYKVEMNRRQNGGFGQIPEPTQFQRDSVRMNPNGGTPGGAVSRQMYPNMFPEAPRVQTFQPVQPATFGQLYMNGRKP